MYLPSESGFPETLSVLLSFSDVALCEPFPIRTSSQNNLLETISFVSLLSTVFQVVLTASQTTYS